MNSKRLEHQTSRSFGGKYFFIPLFSRYGAIKTKAKSIDENQTGKNWWKIFPWQQKGVANVYLLVSSISGF